MQRARIALLLVPSSRHGARRTHTIQSTSALLLGDLMRQLSKSPYDREKEEYEREIALHGRPLSPPPVMGSPRKRGINASSSTTSLHPFPVSEASGGGEAIDESALAEALIRIGEANRHKFMHLMQQISALQQGMINMQSNDRSSSAAASASASASSADAEALRAQQASMAAELSRLQGELQSSVGEKERLANQVRELRLHAERSTFALMEKVALLQFSSSVSADGSSMHSSSQD